MRSSGSVLFLLLTFVERNPLVEGFVSPSHSARWHPGSMERATASTLTQRTRCVVNMISHHHHDKEQSVQEKLDGIQNSLRRFLSVVGLSAALILNPPPVPSSSSTSTSTSTPASFFRPPVAIAADYTSLSNEQKAVAEAWRLVDNSFLDRTFNGQDWFQMRQDTVKRKYKSLDEAHEAIETMVSSLGDKYTRYLSPAKYQSIFNAATGTLAGVGVEISTNKETGEVIALAVQPSSPAAEAGMKAKDVFAEVDGTRMDDGKATPDDVAAKLRGPEGSKVGVVMKRDGQTLDFILTRKPLKITAVSSYMSDKGGVGKVGVIKIKNFSGTTAATVSDELATLKKKGADAYVLDVRGNPGGLLPGGVETASLFLDANKPVVFVVNKKGIVDSQQTLAAGPVLDKPLVVYVDSATASAAEVLTAALKENQRATVVGEQTFGKGVVQTIRALSNDNGGVAITVARYETPEHHDINKQGIPVDLPAAGCEKEDAVSCIPNAAFKAISK